LVLFFKKERLPWANIMSKMQPALLALHAGRMAEAERLLRRLLKHDPDNAEALHCLGIALHAQGQNAQALGFLERSLRLHPASSQAENNRANVLKALGRPAEALASLDRALALKPNDPELHYNRANTLMALLRDEEALASFDAALALQPDFRQALQNKGIVQTRLGRPTEALATYDKFLSLYRAGAPADALLAEARVNRAWALDRLNLRQDALAACDAAIEGDARHALAHFNAAPICLAMGDYERGWREFEWRWQDPVNKIHARNFRQPLWLGREDLRGRRILLYAEQGFGDTIQFCRYASLVKALGAHVILEAPRPLLPLLGGLAGPDELVAFGEKLPEFDFQTPLMSLPLCFGTTVETIPAEVPYLAASADRVAKWQGILGPRRGVRVGLAWSGNPALGSDAMRSAKLADLAPMFCEGIEYIAVQKDVRPHDIPAAAQLGVRLVGEEMRDFADTAALISLMDVVISVDSAPAHLAGALGKPVWVLLYFAAEWRWLMEREDSPWYPTARLFRQRTALDWAEVAGRVAGALAVELVRDRISAG
jgi:tetratricopeptide (TPR) repeat protein